MINNQLKKVAIVVPMYKTTLSEDEKISIHHLHHFLGRYDKYIIAPHGLKLNQPDFKVKRFCSKYFRSLDMYSRLLLKKFFYEQFSEYEYILIYQTDAIVFSDQLLDWCDKGYDYIGAPWFKEFLGKGYEYPDACGNGGFSLRKVSSALKVIEKMTEPWYVTLWKICLAVPYKLWRGRSCITYLINTWVNSAPHRTLLFEDRFWSFEAPKHQDNFTIPSTEEGLKFAFEIFPAESFLKNNKVLPFGCHAWYKYDREFWDQYILN